MLSICSTYRNIVRKVTIYKKNSNMLFFLGFIIIRVSSLCIENYKGKTFYYINVFMQRASPVADHKNIIFMFVNVLVYAFKCQNRNNKMKIASKKKIKMWVKKAWNLFIWMNFLDQKFFLRVCVSSLNYITGYSVLFEIVSSFRFILHTLWQSGGKRLCVCGMQYATHIIK